MCLEGVEMLEHVSIRHEHVQAVLNFHVFDVKDFGIIIGYSMEKLLVHDTTQGDLDIQLGEQTFSVQISRSNNSVTDHSLECEPLEEVLGVMLKDSP